MRILFALILATAATTALASDLQGATKLDCKGALASASIDIHTGTLRGQVRGKTFNNNTIQVVEVVADLPTESTDAIGGSTVGKLGIGQIYAVFSKQQADNLHAVEQAQIMHMDSDGNVQLYPAECRISF